MEEWSDLPIGNFKIKIFLDTNILSCLIDETHSALTESMDILKTSPFVELVSSRYVAFEFVGIRKREHFLRKVIEQAHSNTKGHYNFSTLFNLRDNFKTDDVDFYDINDEIKIIVEQEIDKITSLYNIDYSNNNFHEELYKPTVDICLASRISKEDSLMIVSALLPEISKPEKHIAILSKDDELVKAFKEFPSGDIFSKHGLSKPVILNLRDIESKNLVKELPKNLPEIWNTVIIKLIIEKNNKDYLGHTFLPASPSFPKDIICFNLISDKELTNNTYLTIIGKNLDFIYTTRFKIEEFWNNQPIKKYPFKSSINASNISFKIFDFDEMGNKVSLTVAQINKLRENGNLVFINPDSV